MPRRRDGEWVEYRTYSVDELKEILQQSNSCCHLCGHEHQLGGYVQYWEVEHVHPLALGGTNDLENLMVACGPCNESKGNKLMEHLQLPFDCPWDKCDGHYW